MSDCLGVFLNDVTFEPTGIQLLPLVTIISYANFVKYSMNVQHLNCTGRKCLSCKYCILNRACIRYRIAFLQVPSSSVISLHVTAVDDVRSVNHCLFLMCCACQGMLSDGCSVCGSDGLPSLHLPAVRDKPKISQCHYLVLSFHCIFVTVLFNGEDLIRCRNNYIWPLAA